MPPAGEFLEPVHPHLAAGEQPLRNRAGGVDVASDRCDIGRTDCRIRQAASAVASGLMLPVSPVEDPRK